MPLCESCHGEQHGYIPKCLECHEGHYESQPLKDCKSCHERVHAPLKINLPANSTLQTCGPCHDEVYGKWANTPSKHGQVSCVRCHEAHGSIPNCIDLHGALHNKKQLEMFPNCLTCHIDLHDLPFN